MALIGLLQSINLKDQNRATKYTLDCEKIGSLNRTFNILSSAGYNNQGFFMPEKSWNNFETAVKRAK